ncbi:alpha/beta fold hydrolase [Streptomyces hiroshimensis]|uniref:Hydrolase n=1 Tax=Streptomyces hiroshimensis TaxID=66424 RepID=A0ABQ2Y8B8_9ACTN|nr:alpha/beta hydrolase [Streptomyces hiroshimensis]GGX74696.1 hydrolase [Streptomyces hiroshimensis]
MDPLESGTLAVPGARLYFEVRGSGPLLLLIPGGASDAEVFRDLADELAARHRVVTYDPRGISRSRLDGPPPEPWLLTQTDDAARLLDHLAPNGEPVRVFGSCAGGLTALELMVRDPQRIRLAVVHEPPAIELLPDAARHAAFFDEVYATFRRDGAAAALDRLRALFGGRPAPQLPEATDNSAFFLSHVMLPSSRCVPDVAALAAVADRIVVAGGRESRTYDVHQPAAVLAQLLGRGLVEFPGGHAGYAKHTAPFARQLTGILAAARTVAC